MIRVVSWIAERKILSTASFASIPTQLITFVLTSLAIFLLVLYYTVQCGDAGVCADGAGAHRARGLLQALHRRGPPAQDPLRQGMRYYTTYMLICTYCLFCLGCILQNQILLALK